MRMFFHPFVQVSSPMHVRRRPFLPSILSVLLFIFILNTFQAGAQTFPPASSCTSKDLDMLEVLLQNERPELDHQSGRRQLKLTVTNKTGVDRKSFTVWGTLQRFDNYGNLRSSEPVFMCVDSARKNSTLTLPAKDSLFYAEDETLLITNIYTAWSSASSNENCDFLKTNTTKIAPRCAVKDSIRIYTGINARFNHSRANCGNGKGVLRTLPFGGKGPYKVLVQGENQLVQDTISVNERDSLQLELDPGAYDVTIIDAKRNRNTFRRIIDPPFPLQKPELSITHPNCSMPRGLVRIMNKDNNASYKLIQNGVLRYLAQDSVFEDVETGSYTIVSQRGICRNNDSVLIRARPFIPGRPDFRSRIPAASYLAACSN